MTVIWCLLFFNALTPGKLVLPIPHRIAQLMTQGALFVALFLVLTINPRMRIRPNWYLGLYTVLAISSLMMSIRLVGLGTEYRAFRLIIFHFVLWLLTPWWGRRDLLFLRSQMWFIGLILSSVVLGLLIWPGKALAHGSAEWHHLADLADRGWPLRGRARRSGHVALAVPSRICPSCSPDWPARNRHSRPDPHTHGPPGHDRGVARSGCQPLAGSATGS